MLRVALVGASGRMGSMLFEALSTTDDITVVARIDPRDETALPSITALDAGTVDVVVDFSTTDVARQTITWAQRERVAAVIGTTGFLDHEYDEWAAAFADGHLVIAANFALGAVLAQRFAAQAAPYFERVEVIEYHHDRKVDAPSGTALETARLVREARREAGRSTIPEPTEREPLGHSRGADAGDNVRVHAVRMPGMTAHQDIIFGGPGEGLTIRHDAYDRTSFAAGVLLAVRTVRNRPGLSRGLASLL